MIYNIKQTAGNVILVNYTIPIDTPTYLGVFTGPGNETKTAIIPNSECGDVYELTITGIAESYEDLTIGEIYFASLGTWSVVLYYQASITNLDPSLATLLETFNLQINGCT